MFRRNILAILLALSLVFFIVGCSSSSSSGEGSSSSDASADKEMSEESENSTESENSKGSDESSASSSAKSDSIVGTWQATKTVEEGETLLDMTFGDDGTFTMFEQLQAGQPGEGESEEQQTATGTGSGTYTESGDKLTLTYQNISSEGVSYDGQQIKDDLNGQNVEYTYKLSGDELTLTSPDGTTETLARTQPE